MAEEGKCPASTGWTSTGAPSAHSGGIPHRCTLKKDIHGFHRCGCGFEWACIPKEASRV